MITPREQFHDCRIGERVTIYSLKVQSFLNSQAARFDRQGGDPVLAMKRAFKSLQNTVQVASFVMACSESRSREIFDKRLTSVPMRRHKKAVLMVLVEVRIVC
jgi:tRNA C32,U32 (ribose-2'-O)-methylase TrmJ